MKIARVFIKEYPGRQIGDIHDVFSPENHPGSILSGLLAEVEVADNFDASIMQAEVAEDGAVTFAESPTKVAARAAAIKAKDIVDRYNDMNADVYAEMQQVFGTTKSDSATAYFETWKLMAAKPVLFYQQGLKADKEIGSFQAGDALDTMQKVEDYANARIAEAETYSVNRMARIEQFRVEKAAIEAG